MTTIPEEPPIAVLTLDTTPIPLLNLDGKLITFKADPTADESWANLIRLQTTMKAVDAQDADSVIAATLELKTVLGGFIESGKTHWDKSTKLGLKNLALVLQAYVEKVSEGIPT